MKKNMGMIDRAVRTILALVIIIWFFTKQITGTAAIVLMLFAVVFLVTSYFSVCPLYNLLKISTIKKPKK